MKHWIDPFRPLFCPGMSQLMDLLELMDIDLGIDFRGFQVGVTEHLLDVADVRAVFEHLTPAQV